MRKKEVCFKEEILEAEPTPSIKSIYPHFLTSMSYKSLKHFLRWAGENTFYAEDSQAMLAFVRSDFVLGIYASFPARYNQTRCKITELDVCLQKMQTVSGSIKIEPYRGL